MTRKDIKTGWFQEIYIFEVSADIEKLPERVKDLLGISRKIREKERHLWTHSVLQTICKNAVDHFARESLSRFSFVKTLAPGISSNLTGSKPWLDLSKQVRCKNEMRCSVAPVLGYCFASYTMRMRHIFKAEEVFNELFRSLSEEILQGDGLLDVVMSTMCSATAEYEQVGSNWKIAHFGRLGSHYQFWERTHSNRICFMCMITPCQIILPCRHTLCERCYRAFGTQPTSFTTFSTPVTYDVCPFCRKKWNEPVQVLLRPPTGQLIVLALDGGGIKGIVAIATMLFLESSINLGIP